MYSEYKLNDKSRLYYYTCMLSQYYKNNTEPSRESPAPKTSLDLSFSLNRKKLCTVYLHVIDSTKIKIMRCKNRYIEGKI